MDLITSSSANGAVGNEAKISQASCLAALESKDTSDGRFTQYFRTARNEVRMTYVGSEFLHMKTHNLNVVVGWER